MTFTSFSTVRAWILVVNLNLFLCVANPWYSLSFPMLQLTVWINEKMLTAQDTSYDEARNLHSKWLKHQAFMAELASNKDWLNKVDQVSNAVYERGMLI